MVKQSPSDDTPQRQPRKLNVQTLIRLSQTLSEETDLDRLTEVLLVSSIEYAGAVRCLMLLDNDGEMRAVGEAVLSADTSLFTRFKPAVTVSGVPASVMDQASKTRQPIVLANVSEWNSYGRDPYFSSSPARALLCLPLGGKPRLSGILYFEYATPHNFSATEIQLLQLLASQVAVYVDNARLLESARRAEREARSARDALRQEFDFMPVQVWRTDANGVFEAANKQWYDFTGLSPEDAIDYSRTCHPDDRDKVFDLFRQLLNTGLPGEVECRMLRHDGAYRRVLARAAPLKDDTGSVIRWHGTTVDIEDVKRAAEAQEAMARLSRVNALGELTVSIAHEINQPLMAIVTNAATCLRWLSAQPANVAEAKLAAERIVRDGHRAGEVIAGIRGLAQKSAEAFVEIDVNNLIAEVLVFTGNELNRNGIGLDLDLSTEACKTRGDRVQVQQVMLNLILNGIEAIAGGDVGDRVLRVVTRLVDDRAILVSISDTGPGLAPGNADRIFDAFFTTKPGGIGMGLSICRSIAESHGGQISVSANVPRGCTFSLALPALAP